MVVLVAAVTASGCASRSIVTPEQVTPRSELSLHFEPPRAVTLRSDAGETLVLERIVELSGRLIESSEDSILIRATSVKFADGRTEPFGVGVNTSFARTEVTMEEVAFSAGKTIAAVVGIGLLLVLIASITGGSEPDPPPPPPKYDDDYGK
jgi:hypothetical protein